MKWFLKKFVLYSKPLYIATFFFVISCQAYWLWNNYQLRKHQLLEQTALMMEKQLMTLSIKQVLGVGNGINDKTPPAINLDSIMQLINKSAHTNATVIVRDLSNGISIPGTDVLSDNTMTQISDNNYDSLLYEYVKKNSKPMSGNSGLVIYHHNFKEESTYPSAQPVVSENNTNTISSVLGNGGSYQAHIGRLSWIVLKGMTGLIVISILYVLLFLATITTLIQTALLNKKLLESKEIFTQNMTHELKIPIATLSVATEALNKYSAVGEPAATQKYIGIIQRGIAQLSTIVDTILVNARLQHHQESLNISVVNLKVLLSDVMETMQLQIAESNAIININGVPENSIFSADYYQMKHVFLNLIDNAIKYTDKAPVITISFRQDSKYTQITVQDNGFGIPAKYFTEVFQPYFRVSENNVHNVKGFGLGLSFIQKVLFMHHGTVEIMKSGTDGTQITLKIPLC